jgi:ubiquinone/menaquinone biosynthesis C-methylase UbiE
MIDQRAQHASQRAYFDRHFAGYKDYRLENWRISYIERIQRELGMLGRRLSPAFRYLDVGVGGSGYTVIEAARLGATAWGVDLSEVGVANAARLAEGALPKAAAKRCRFQAAAAEALPFKASTFDAVSSIAVLEHVVEDRQAMAEIARVLKPGGRCFLTVPHAFSRTPLLLVPVIWGVDKVVGHLRHYTQEGLQEAMAPMGLRCVKVIHHMHMVKFWQQILALGLKDLRRPDSALWWRMERKDLAQWQDPRSAMITVVMQKERSKRR